MKCPAASSFSNLRSHAALYHTRYHPILQRRKLRHTVGRLLRITQLVNGVARFPKSMLFLSHTDSFYCAHACRGQHSAHP